jgi:hypothetical protein
MPRFCQCFNVTILISLFVIASYTLQVHSQQLSFQQNPISKGKNLSVETLSPPSQWQQLKPILISRLNQKSHKMKLNRDQVSSLIKFLYTLDHQVPVLVSLQNHLPKTSLELVRAIHERGVSINEAEKMAGFLQTFVARCRFRNLKNFDENTSHIIGREWHEIDYSGENMTWEKQRQKYLPYGIDNFKTVNQLNKFFQVESKLPYFNLIYRPTSSCLPAR